MFKTFEQFGFNTYVFYDLQKRAVGRIEAGQSITDVALFFGVHHSVISRLWKQFQTPQTGPRRGDRGPKARRWSPKGCNTRRISIYCYCSQAESDTCGSGVPSMVTAFIGR
ncbi:uncharacterized protein TNCV_1325671 [Trichonephila clavipes]|nr:uncharacterized protein TNCV_1325671 [Trichonephila clavipes]